MERETVDLNPHHSPGYSGSQVLRSPQSCATRVAGHAELPGLLLLLFSAEGGGRAFIFVFF
jgi:hypothetical protein